MSGIFAGADYESKLWDLALIASEPAFVPDLARHDKKVEAFANQHNKREFDNVTAGQISDGLDKLYSDYRNRRIEAEQALIVVLRSLDGTSDAEIETLLEKDRAAAAK